VLIYTTYGSYNEDLIKKNDKIYITMKSVFRIALMAAILAAISAFNLQAQRVIKGTVYNNGEPAAGVTVEAHRGGSMMTSFDGKYEVEADDRTKWIGLLLLLNPKDWIFQIKQEILLILLLMGKFPATVKKKGKM
jgi:hypothetical protein